MYSQYAQPLTHTLERLNIKPTARMLLVSIERQELALVSEGVEIRRFQVSTSANRPSCIENSYGTPTGLHCIDAMIGDDAPLGEVFASRRSTGRRYWELAAADQEPNLVTTRLLWLEGLEVGRNSGPGIDSRERYIYIHGTNHENRIGQPVSGGCILLRNEEVIELFNLVCPGDLVFIAP